MFLEITQKIGRSLIKTNIHQNNPELFYFLESGSVYSKIWGRWPWQSSVLPKGFEIDIDRAEKMFSKKIISMTFVEIPAIGFKLLEQNKTLEVKSRSLLSGIVISTNRGSLIQSSVYILTTHGEPLLMEALLQKCG